MSQQINGAVPVLGTATVQVTGQGGVPAVNVAAVVLNVTVVSPQTAGYITVWPFGIGRTTTSNLNFQAGQDIPNTVIVPVGPDGKIQLFNGSAGTVHLLVDVTGYTLAGTADGTAPGPVTAPTVAAVTARSLTLHWTNPIDADLTGVVIRRAEGATPPPSLNDGVFVADVPVPQVAVTDSGLAASTTYSYALFAHDGAGNYAAGANVSGITTVLPPLWAWGTGFSGQLGNGGTGNTSVPVAVSGLTSVTAIAAGGSTGYALRGDGTVWAWGDGTYGQLGNGSYASTSVPVRFGLTTFTAIGAGFDNGYAVGVGGTVWAAGDGIALGTGSNVSSSTPVQVSGLTNVTSLAGAVWVAYALRSDGAVWAWGSGFGGGLGDGSTTSASVPVQVSGLTDVAAIAGGGSTGYALRTDGTVRAWGAGANGQLGNGGVADSSVPVQVSGLTNVTVIAAGSNTAFAIR